MKEVKSISCNDLITNYNRIFKKPLMLRKFGFQKGELEKLLLSLNIVRVSGTGYNKKITLKENMVIQKETETLADFENSVMEWELNNQEQLKN